MSLEFWKDGKKVECRPIYDEGLVGQVVILDHVSFGEDPDPTDKPLASYPQPACFTIVEKVKGARGSYVIADRDGNRIYVSETTGWYLYEASNWVAWTKLHSKEKLASKNRKIEQLEAQVALLKDILVRQGIRIVTKEEAESLVLQS